MNKNEFIVLSGNTIVAKWENKTLTIHFICNSAESLVDCLTSFTNSTYSWRTPFRNKSGKWIDASGKSRVENTLKSIKEQERLLSLPLERRLIAMLT